MSYISSFSSLEELSTYYSSTLYSTTLPYITFKYNYTPTQEQFASHYPTIAPTSRIIDSISNNLGRTHVSYEISKSVYRTTFHSNMISSFYKLYFDALKKHKYVVESTSFSFILVDKPITEDFYQSVSSFNSFSSSSLLDNITQVITSYDLDTSFYLDKISSLQKEVDSLKQLLSESQTDLYNKSISTWY